MALAIGEIQSYHITVSNIVNRHTADPADTQQAVPNGLADRLNALWTDQILAAQPQGVEEIRETVQRNPERHEVTTGVTEPDWTFTTAAWSPDMLELHSRRATFVYRPIRNTGSPGIASGFAGADNYTCTGVVFVTPPEADSSRSPASNSATVTIEVENFFHRNGTVEMLHRDIAGKIWREHGVDRMRGLRQALAARTA